MANFTNVEETLFVPMLGRIYASENFPWIFYDEKAMELKEKLPPHIKGQDTQTQYTFMASAIRSVHMDHYVVDFLEKYSDGIIVELGCGLETTFYRNDNGKNMWYEIDLPNVICKRERLLGTHERNKMMKADAFNEEWILQIRKEYPTSPILVIASGLLYYFERKKVLDLFRMLQKFGNIEIVFDTVNHKGMKQMGKYMKQVGHGNMNLYFHVDNANDLANKIGAKLIEEKPYYINLDKSKFKLITKITMKVSDYFNMVKMIHIRLSD